MTTRIAGLVRGHEIVAALGLAAVIGLVMAVVRYLDRMALIVALSAVLVVFGGLLVWLLRQHHVVHWTTSAGTPERPRGADRRITGLARSIDKAIAGGQNAEHARTEVRASLRVLAEARLTRLGLTTDLTDRAAAAALGPELTAYLTASTPPQVDATRLQSFITTLEEPA